MLIRASKEEHSTNFVPKKLELGCTIQVVIAWVLAAVPRVTGVRVRFLPRPVGRIVSFRREPTVFFFGRDFASANCNNVWVTPTFPLPPGQISAQDYCSLIVRLSLRALGFGFHFGVIRFSTSSYRLFLLGSIT